MPLTRCAEKFRGDATAPAEVRHLLQSKLEAVGCGDAVPAAQLLASEVVTNAVIHTNCEECEVVIEVDDRVVRVSVHDCDRHSLPKILPADPGRYGGLGLKIVNDVACGWGCDTSGHGKTVWFELPRAA
jgi:anti-sigma regulatory factor (Ser/Thr protein kinase)